MRPGERDVGQGQIEELAGRWPEAQAQYEKAVQLVPGDGFTHFLLGRCLLEQADRAKAAAAAADGDDAERRFTRAAAELGRATELAPDLGVAWSELGAAHFADGSSPQAARAAFATAHRLLPLRWEVTLNLAMACARTGERQTSEALVERARAAGAPPDALDQVRKQLEQIRAGLNRR